MKLAADRAPRAGNGPFHLSWAASGFPVLVPVA